MTDFSDRMMPPRTFSAVDVSEFIHLKILPRENILTPWMPQQGLAMIYASRGIGKTFIALGIAHAVVTGTSFLKWSAPKPRGVLYLDGEMPASLMQERLKMIFQAGEITANVPFRLLTPDMQEAAMPDLTQQSDQAQLEPFLDDIGLIIIDNISTLCRSGKENDADAWIPVQDWALRMRASGRSVLFIHHAGKGGMQRGTSKREDILDTVISLQQSVDYNASVGASFEIHFEKTRGFCGSDAESFNACLHTADGVTHWEMGAAAPTTFAKVIEMTQQGQPQHEIAKMLNIHKSNVSRHILRAKQEGKLRGCVYQGIE